MASEYERFSRLQRCSVCHLGLLAEAEPRICSNPNCQAVAVCPPLHEWPAGMIEYLRELDFHQRMKVFREYMSEQQLAEELMRCCFIGRGVLKWAATADDCWPAAVKAFEKWQAERELAKSTPASARTAA